MSVQEIWSERGYSRQALNRLKIWFLPFLVLYFIEKSQNITEDSPLSCSPFLYLWLSGQRHQAPTQRWSRYCQFSRSLCPTLCDPMDCSTPGFPVYHQLPEFAQTHLNRAGDAIQPSHPLSTPSPPAFSLSQHQGLFQWTGSSHQVAKVLKFQLQMSPSNEYSDWFPSGMTGWISLWSKGLSRVSSNTTVQKHQFFGAQLSSQSNSHIHTWLLEKP